MNKKVTFIVVAAFVLALGAGTLMGVSLSRLSKPPVPPPRSLTEQLHLTPEQEKKVKEIWDTFTARYSPGSSSPGARLRNERDSAIVALIPESRKKDYEKVLQDYETKVKELESERMAAFEAAQKQMREALTPEQQKQLDQIQHERRWDRGPRDGDRGGRNAGPFGPGGFPRGPGRGQRGPGGGPASIPGTMPTAGETSK